ncbi:MAG: DNA repair protein RecN [Planctomycetota bacterium]
MLRELHISQLAVIEDATVTFEPGLNVFTGQTGAGKSLVLGALEALLGLRKAVDLIRPGADEARISAVFDPPESPPEVSAALSEALDQPIEPGDEILITRKLFASGRSSLSVNGRPATAAMMRHAAGLLVDIHGQHDHQFLLKPSNQLAVLDAYAGTADDRRAFADAFAERRRLTDERETLDASTTLRRQQLELYEFQAQEIDAAELQPGEFPELRARERVLGSVQKLQGEAAAAHAALYDAEGSVTERLQAITHLLIDLAELDPALGEVTDQVRTATLSLQEASFELGRYVDRLEHDPAEAAEVADRLNQLNRVIQKYGDGVPGDDPALAVLDLRTKLADQIDDLRGQSEDRDRLDQRLDELDRRLATLGESLTLARRKAAKTLTPRIEKQLAELGMAEAKLTVAFDRVDDSAAGFDAVEFVVQTNPGQDARPLRQIASGGELSRVMLALKSVLADTGDSQRVSVLVFDEVDANIGGRLGSVIGTKLRALAKPTFAERGRPPRKPNRPTAPPLNHQILCITHLPQIAAYADRHFRIVKSVAGRGQSKQTRTTVDVLTGDARVAELAEMMAGAKVTATSRRQAKELLAAAQ